MPPGKDAQGALGLAHGQQLHGSGERRPALVQAGTPSKNSTSRAARSASAVVTVNTVSTT